MGKTVAVFNQKGGVGKTTTCVNLAAIFGEKGLKTLLVDVDPQGNSTSGVGFDKALVKKSTYDVIINRLPVKDAVTPTQFKNLFLLPANMNLAGAELELAETEDRNGALKRALAPILYDYDYILIDCPPSLGLLSLNGLVASDTLLIPLQCEFYALEGMSQLLSTIRTVKQYYNEHLEIEGVVYTMFDSRLKLSRQIVEEVNKYFPNKGYKTLIPRSVRLAEAPSYGLPIIYYDKYCKASFAYRKLAGEILAKQ